ncbi:unnamed protein product [Amoebophrya sp. A120]|nr:unnamed protein product [Amoebophrya sp. A120]|eukprot:GSA120T00025500001.1
MVYKNFLTRRCAAYDYIQIGDLNQVQQLEAKFASNKPRQGIASRCTRVFSSWSARANFVVDYEDSAIESQVYDRRRLLDRRTMGKGHRYDQRHVGRIKKRCPQPEAVMRIRYNSAAQKHTQTVLRTTTVPTTW